MSIFSSLFGIGRSPSYQTTTQTTKLDPTIAPYAKKALDEAESIYDTSMEAGYIPYEGQTIAEFTPEQQRAMEGLAGLSGLGRPLQEEALDLARGQKERFTADVAREYMSPYQQAVTDIEKREAQTDFESLVMPQFEKQAIDAGGMSGLGSRAGVQASLLGQAQMQKLGDIQTKGLQAAYQDAQTQFAAQKARERGLSSDLMAAAPAMAQQQLRELGALQTVGEQKQQMAQQALDEAYFREMERRNFPQDKLAEYTGFIYGNPLMQNRQRTTQAPLPRGPGWGQQLLGLAGTAANIYGMGGGAAFGGPGFSPKNLYKSGFFNLKGGGGLSNLPIIKRRTSGPLTLDIPKLRIGDTIIDPSEYKGELAEAMEKREEGAAAERAKAIAAEVARRREAQRQKYSDLEKVTSEAFARERGLAPDDRGAFFRGFSKGAMNISGQDQRPIGLIEALISAGSGGAKSLAEARRERRDALREIAKRRGTLDIERIGQKADALENIERKLTYREKMNAINANAKLKEKLAGLPAAKQKAIIEQSTSIADLVKKLAEAAEKRAEAATAGKSAKSPGYNVVRKAYETLVNQGLIIRKTMSDGSFGPIQSVRIKGKMVPLTDDGIKEYNKIFAKANEIYRDSNNESKAITYMQTALQNLSGVKLKKVDDDPTNQKKPQKNKRVRRKSATIVRPKNEVK